MKYGREVTRVFKDVGLGSNAAHAVDKDYGLSPLVTENIRKKRYLIEIPKLVKRYKMNVGRYQIYGKDSLEVVL